MSALTMFIPTRQLRKSGFTNANINYQLSHEELTEQALQRGEGVLNNTGALVINTGEFTGRSPKDKFTVKDEITANTVNWNDFNIPIDQKYFDIIREKINTHLNSKEEIWIRDCYACADERFRLNIRVVSE